MAHFARIDENGIVIDMLVVSDSDTVDENGVEKQEIGQAYLHNAFGGSWIQYSYNGRIRKQLPAIGYKYDAENDVFVAPRPYRQWELNEHFDWEPPVPMPEPIDGYHWHWEEKGDGAWESHLNDTETLE